MNAPFVADFKDIQATAMGLSHSDSGQFVVLGGKKTLALINLSDPKNVAKKITRAVGKWDVTSVQWAPISNLIAVAANDRIEVVNGDLEQVQVLKSHTRFVSDLGKNYFL